MVTTLGSLLSLMESELLQHNRPKSYFIKFVVLDVIKAYLREKEGVDM